MMLRAYTEPLRLHFHRRFLATASVAVICQAQNRLENFSSRIPRPPKPGGYSDSGADIAYVLQNRGFNVITPTQSPRTEVDLDWVFPDTEEGILAALAGGATTLWMNTTLDPQHPINALTPDQQRAVSIVGQLPSRHNMFDDKWGIRALLRAAGVAMPNCIRVCCDQPQQLELIDPFSDCPVPSKLEDICSALARGEMPALAETESTTDWRDWVEAHISTLTTAQVERLGMIFPLVVKPIRGRGSQGVSKIDNFGQLQSALAALFAEVTVVEILEQWSAGTPANQAPGELITNPQNSSGAAALPVNASETLVDRLVRVYTPPSAGPSPRQSAERTVLDPTSTLAPTTLAPSSVDALWKTYAPQDPSVSQYETLLEGGGQVRYRRQPYPRFGTAAMVEQFLPGEEVTVTVMPPGTYQYGAAHPLAGKSFSHADYWCLEPVLRVGHADGVAPYNGEVPVSANSRLFTTEELSQVETAEALAQLQFACTAIGRVTRARAPIRVDARTDMPSVNVVVGQKQQVMLQGQFRVFDVNMKPNMTAPGRVGRQNQVSLVGLAAAGKRTAWSPTELLVQMLSLAWSGQDVHSQL